MGWLERYAQAVETQDAQAQDAAPGQAYPEAGREANKPLFDGEAVNKIVVKKVLAPLDRIPKEAMAYLKASNKSAVDKFVLDLAVNGKLRGFMDVVESYVKNGTWTVVSTGSQEGASAFQKWYQDMTYYTANRDIFGMTEVEQSGLGVM